MRTSWWKGGRGMVGRGLASDRVPKAYNFRDVRKCALHTRICCFFFGCDPSDMSIGIRITLPDKPDAKGQATMLLVHHIDRSIRK